MLTQERLKELLHYDPDTGVWTWVVACRRDAGRSGGRNRVKVGDQAGSIDCWRGYRVIGVDGVVYRSPRLAHLYMTGSWPVAFMDHINGVKDDDRWINLRNATYLENNRNRCGNINNQTGIKGVAKVRNRYRVRIGIDGKDIHLGYFATREEATAVRRAAEARIQGEFAFSNRETAPTEYMEAAE